MPLTTLDADTALIVIDLQKGLMGESFLHPLPDILERTRLLIDAFRAKNLPVVLVNVAGRAPGRTEQGSRSKMALAEGWTELLPELDPQPSDILITKRSWGAFATTDLQRQLAARHVTQVVLTGVATSVGVEATARQAYEQGFHVTIATDAVTDAGEEAHLYSLHHIFPRLAETGTSAEILSLLDTTPKRAEVAV